MRQAEFRLVLLCLVFLVSQAVQATGRFINLTVDQVLDRRTHLVWQTRPPEDKVNYDQALQYCEALELDKQSDWRLPLIKELASIVDENSYNPSIYPYFKTKARFYWSVTENAADRAFAWLVNFSDSHIHSFLKSSRYYARCVREHEPN